MATPIAFFKGSLPPETFKRISIIFDGSLVSANVAHFHEILFELLLSPILYNKHHRHTIKTNTRWPH